MDNDDRNTNDAPSDKKEKKYIYEPKEQVSTGWNIAFCIVAAVIARFVPSDSFLVIMGTFLVIFSVLYYLRYRYINRDRASSPSETNEDLDTPSHNDDVE